MSSDLAAPIAQFGEGKRIAALCAAAILIAGRLLPLPGANGEIFGIPDFCPFRCLTHLPCPFCGMTRSVVCAMHGRFAQSVSYHPLGLPLCTVLVGIVAVESIQLIRHKHIQIYTEMLHARAFWPAVCALLALAWIARLCGFDPLPN